MISAPDRSMTIVSPITGLVVLLSFPLSHASPSITPGYRGVGLKRKRPAVVSQESSEFQSRLHPMRVNEYSKGGGKGHDASRDGASSEATVATKTKLKAANSFEAWLKEGFDVGEESALDRHFDSMPDRRNPNPNNATRRGLNVFNVDDRVLANPEMMDQYPFRCVGQFVRGSSFCTGTIVGKDLILTNRHCLGLVNNKLPSDFYSNSRFLSGFSNGESNFVATFTEVYWSEEVDDFALLLLSQNIGVFTGWPAISWTFNSYFVEEKTLALLGYSGDVLQRHNAPSYVDSCRSRGVANGVVMHDCDNTRGSSGSPVFDSFYSENPTIIAYNDGEFRRGELSEFLEEFAPANANTMKPSGLFRDTYTFVTTGVSASAAEDEGLSDAAEFFLYAGIPILILVAIVAWVRWKNGEQEKNKRKAHAII